MFRAGGSGGWDAEARGGRVGTSVGSRAAYGASRESAPTRRRLFRAALAPRTRACRTARPRQQKPTRRNVSYRRFVRFDRGIDRGPTRRAGFERRTRKARMRCRFSHARRFFSFSILFTCAPSGMPTQKITKLMPTAWKSCIRFLITGSSRSLKGIRTFAILSCISLKSR